MGEEIGTHRFRSEDFAEYRCRLLHETALLEECLQSAVFPPVEPTGGYEVEACLVDAAGQPCAVNAALLDRLCSPAVVTELARFDIEINGPPQRLCGGALRAMQQDIDRLWQQCNAVAREFDTELLAVGILPTLTDDHLTLERMSAQERYRALNEQVFRLRRGEPIALHISGREQLRTIHRDVMLEAAATSFQIHLQVAPERAARLYNLAVILSAPMVAVAANSPFLFGRDLWDETRIPLFEQSVDLTPAGSAPRVTLGDGYVQESLIECFHENVARHVVLLPILKDDRPDTFAHVRLHNDTI
ncbi:MAG: hypothetical protein HY308_05335 [Gammaproteobacteria bacterium]|nr:hypothetical protein [Gammaproteobacteria bacterium]